MIRKNEIQPLIVRAMKAIEAVGIAKNGKIDEVHKGYINSLGANIVQSGLLPALIFYNKDERKRWLRALYFMEKEQTDKCDTAIIKLVTAGKEGALKDLVSPSWEKKILTYAVALKLASRTFEFVSDDSKKEAKP